MDNKRDISLDGLKGLAIILVITGHIIAFSQPKTFNSSLLFNLIYSFHMPLFFFISGYLVYGRFGPTPFGWVQKKFMQLIIPYVVFTLFYFFILFSPSISTITPLKIFQVLLAFTVPDSAWFLPVLFEAFILLALCIAGEKVMGKRIFFLFFLLVSCIIPLCDFGTVPAVHQIVFYTPFVILGYLVSEHREFFLSGMPVIGITGSVLFFLLFAIKFWKLLPSVNFPLFSLYYSYVLAVAGIILSWFVIGKTIHIPWVSVLAIPGILSMEIYLTHLVFINYFTFRHWPLWIGTGLMAIITGTLILLLLSVLASLLLSYNKKVSTVIFGRWSWKVLYSSGMISGNGFIKGNKNE